VNIRKFWLNLSLFSTSGLFWALCIWAVCSCTPLIAADDDRASTNQSPPASLIAAPPVLWSSDFSQNLSNWQIQEEGNWGEANRTIIAGDDRFPHILRVRYPSGSASPTVHRQTDAPLGGTQFYARLGLPAQDSLRLSYFVRFSENFDFVKGGKLPGLFGGIGNTGGNIPDGDDGFSTRFMWRRSGEGEVYAYLPTSEEHGTSIGRGSWSFRPDTWYRLEQEITLNQPGQSNGRVRVWVDDRLLLERSNLMFRSVETLKIEGILFSTFFGGSDPSWATPDDAFADFADFKVTAGSAQPQD
jgi:hypothetical protein